MPSKLTHNPANNHSERTFHIITFGLLCLGILLLILAVQSTCDLLQLHLFGIEVNGIVIRQEIEEQSVERYDDGQEYTEDGVPAKTPRKSAHPTGN